MVVVLLRFFFSIKWIRLATPPLAHSGWLRQLASNVWKDGCGLARFSAGKSRIALWSSEGAPVIWTMVCSGSVRGGFGPEARVVPDVGHPVHGGSGSAAAARGVLGRRLWRTAGREKARNRGQPGQRRARPGPLRQNYQGRGTEEEEQKETARKGEEAITSCCMEPFISITRKQKVGVN